jgi:hypothetical protein
MSTLQLKMVLMFWAHNPTSFKRVSFFVSVIGAKPNHVPLKYQIMSPTLSANPTLFVIPCNFFWGLHIYTVANTVSFQVDFHPKFNHPWQCFITSCWQKKVGIWPKDELIHHSWQYLFISSQEVSSKKLPNPTLDFLFNVDDKIEHLVYYLCCRCLEPIHEIITWDSCMRSII